MHARTFWRLKRKKTIAIESFYDLYRLEFDLYHINGIKPAKDLTTTARPQQCSNKLHDHHKLWYLPVCHTFLDPTLRRYILYHNGRRQRKYGNTRQKFLAELFYAELCLLSMSIGIGVDLSKILGGREVRTIGDD